MNTALLRCVALLVLAASTSAGAICANGAYGRVGGDFVVVVSLPQIPEPGQRYLFRDGRRGVTTDSGSPVTCADGAVELRGANGEVVRWPAIAFADARTTFDSVGTPLAGQLIEPPRAASAGGDAKPPMVVMVHGSERSASVGANPYAFALAAQGIAVFVYDKRGTGASEGDYTQNFPLLAEDAAAALREARRMADGRYGRAGFFGGSQGGWIAPLAAIYTPADFVAVGFGLVASPIEEDREEMVSQAQALGLGDDAMQAITLLSKATSTLLLSEFERGYDALAAARRAFAGKPWAHAIHGEYSGYFLSMDDALLRRVGHARFDNLELVWDYDAVAVLRKLDVPLLWVLAEQDREAPIGTTRAALRELIAAGRPIDAYIFPDTDHGMVEFATNADGSRSIERITDGYLALLGDWIKDEATGRYGRATQLEASRVR